jgi:hypothetical protein
MSANLELSRVRRAACHLPFSQSLLAHSVHQRSRLFFTPSPVTNGVSCEKLSRMTVLN